MAGDLVCWSCGASLKETPRPISRHANCPKCYEVLHCCRMCRWYAPGRPADCDHDRADPPVEKENANFCEYFSPASGTYESEEGVKKEAAKSKLASLFDEGSEDETGANSDPGLTDQDEVRSKLDDLFKD